MTDWENAGIYWKIFGEADFRDVCLLFSLVFCGEVLTLRMAQPPYVLILEAGLHFHLCWIPVQLPSSLFTGYASRFSHKFLYIFVMFICRWLSSRPDDVISHYNTLFCLAEHCFRQTAHANPYQLNTLHDSRPLLTHTKDVFVYLALKQCCLRTWSSTVFISHEIDVMTRLNTEPNYGHRPLALSQHKLNLDNSDFILIVRFRAFKFGRGHFVILCKCCA